LLRRIKPLILSFLSICVLCRSYAADNRCRLHHGWISYSISDTLNDKRTGKYYVLFRSERCIRAFDRRHKILWETNPWECLESSGILKLNWGPRDVDSILVEEIRFGKTIYMSGKEAIMIYFSERIFGAIDKKSGRCAILGQD
jgi:hypothetical protein